MGRASAALVLDGDVHVVEFGSVEVVEDVAEVSGRSLNLRVIVDFDAVLSFIMVEEELVVVANTCKREEAWGRLPANAESVFAVVVNLGLDWR